jgi:hypothetical protein
METRSYRFGGNEDTPPRARRLGRPALWLGATVLAALALLTGPASSAAADDGCGCAPCGRSGSYHAPCHPSTRVVVSRGRGCGGNRGYGYRGVRGGTWAELRRGLGQGSFYDPTRRWVRDNYLTRFPFAHVEGTEAERMQILLSEDLLAVMSEEQGTAAVLDAGTRLDRAAARFFVADYDGAREDLQAVLAAQPKEPRAQWGLFLCAVCKSEWEPAGRALKTLAEAGEIKPGDRIDPERTFADPKVFPSIVRGLQTYADMKISDGSMHLITAWALSTQGELATARRYVALARRWKADAQATEAVATAVAAAPAQAAPSKKAEARPRQAPLDQGEADDRQEPRSESSPGVRAPQGPALERQTANAKKTRTELASR